MAQHNYSTEEYLTELKRELKMRQQVYPGQIQAGKISKLTANKRYILLDQIRILLEEMDRTGFTMENMLSELATINTKARVVQQKLFP